MNSAKINDWVQIIGIFALVASLIFVGLQLKQAQDIALSQISQERTNSTIDMIVNSAENEHFLSASAKRVTGRADTITTEESIAISQYARALLYRYENQHFQYTNGFLTEDRWQASMATVADFLSEESLLPMRGTYEANRARYSAGFQRVMDAQIALMDSANRSD